ncbi:MAG: IS1634 family transposase, partial [Akkermansia sp.]
METFRDNGKVKQRIVHHVGVIRDEQHEVQLRRLAEFIKAKLESEGTQEQMFSPEEMAQFVIDGRELIKKQDESLHAEESIPIDLKNIREEQRITVGIHEVYGEIYEELNLGTILENPRKFKTSNQLLKDITLLRIANPQSKKSSVQDLLKNYGLQLNLTSVYNMMNLIDHKAILRIKENAKAQAVKLFGEEIQILYYDCTTLYFESFEEDQLRQKGFSKEHKVNETQIVLALAVTKEGIPIDYEVFAGSTSEGTTMQTVLERLKGRWEQSKIRLVADSALLTQKNITWLEQHQIEYILGGKPKAQKFLLKEKILTWSDTLDKTKNALTQFNLEDGRIMHVSYSAKRAQKDNKQRLSALEKLKKKLEKSHSTKSFING